MTDSRPVLTVNEILARDRKLPERFAIELEGGCRLEAEAVLRLLPGRRLTVRARLRGRGVLAKLFFGRAPSLGATREVGHDMRQLGARRVLVVTDPRLATSEPVKITMASLRDEKIDAVLFDQVRIEPTEMPVGSRALVNRS